MNVEFIIALIVAIPIILFPAAFVWYLNVGGLVKAVQARKEKEAETAKVKV